MRVAVITVSDSVCAGTREDRSGPELCERMRQNGAQIVRALAIPDERSRIAAELIGACEDGCALVLTTGGTGVAPRDVTPEATRDVVEREIPGLTELMRAEGLKQTRRAVLSRAVAGTRGSTLIVNLPGSPKGAIESLDAIADLIPHVVDLLEGRTEHKAG